MLRIPEAVRPRILIAEDDPMVLELITTRLELAGYQTFSARDGSESGWLEGLCRDF